MKRLLIVLLAVFLLAGTSFAGPDVWLLPYGGPNWGGMTASLIPATDDTYDLGSSSLQWKDLYIDGSAYIDILGETILPASTSVDLGSLTSPFGTVYARTRLQVGAANSSSSGIIVIIEDSDNGTNTLSLDIADALSANYTQTFPSQTGTVMNNLVEDTTPQLGGNLDGQTYAFTTTGTISGAMLIGSSISTNTSLTSAQMNRIYTVTAAVEVTLPDVCDSATGTWVMLIVQDDSEKLEIAFTDGSDQFILLDGTALAAGNELDSDSSADSGGDFICVVCTATNTWRSTSENGTWSDGGAAD